MIDRFAYKVGRRTFFIAVWKHGVSIYGWEHGRDAGFTARHPELKTGRRRDTAADATRRR
ncbi:MAG: hypothetical protein M3024_03610 [Candidatus Dormibacteraeota bacterium]|nr:hypothetical protein [Candidatus Dormibacteraeota bacterium]